MKLAEKARKETEALIQKEREKFSDLFETAKKNVLRKVQESQENCRFEARISSTFSLTFKSTEIQNKISEKMFEWLLDEGFQFVKPKDSELHFNIRW